MPPRPGDILEVTIDTLAYGGQGIARADDFVLFIRGTVPGDTARVQVTKRKKGYGQARLLEIVRPSSARVTPPCRHAADCGGCEWQSLAYASQLEFKDRQVHESLEHIGGFSGYERLPIAGMTTPWRYRNKMEFSFGQSDGRTVLGLHRRNSWHEIVELEECLLAPEVVDKARVAVLQACRGLGLAAHDQRSHTGLLRHLVVRHGRASGDLFLNLFVSARFAEEKELAARVAAVRPFTSFAVTVNDSMGDAATGDGPHMIEGPDYFREELAGVRLKVPAAAFLQTNSEMCDVLYRTAIEFAAPDAAHDAYDLYCGIGSISLLLARAAGHVHGIEIQPEAIIAAQENARLNGIGNVAFAAGDVRRLLKERLAAAPAAPTVVVVDPPRAGMARKSVDRAAGLGAARIVYVSCNPTTLAANGAQLRELGYRLTRVVPVDMFPQTHHIETVSLFERI